MKKKKKAVIQEKSNKAFSKKYIKKVQKLIDTINKKYFPKYEKNIFEVNKNCWKVKNDFSDDNYRDDLSCAGGFIFAYKINEPLHHEDKYYESIKSYITLSSNPIKKPKEIIKKKFGIKYIPSEARAAYYQYDPEYTRFTINYESGGRERAMFEGENNKFARIIVRFNSGDAIESFIDQIIYHEKFL